MKRDVTVCIPSIPPRTGMLQRALASVAAQTQPAMAVAIAYDNDHEGAWATRNRALARVDTTWTAFLDDDDEFTRGHLQHLLDCAETHNADCTWAWFEVVGGGDPFPHYRGRQYDPSNPHVVPITYLVRTSLLHDAVDKMGGFQPDTPGGGGVWDLQDMPLLNAYVDLGGRLYASPQSSWLWHHHGRNTSGMPHRWE